MSQQLDGGLESQPGLGFFDLSSPGPFAGLVERPLAISSIPTQRLDAVGQLADLLALLASTLDQLAVVGVENLMMGTDEGGQPVEHHDRALDVDPALLGHEAGVRISRQASLVVVQPALQHLGPLAQTGSAHFEIAPPPDQHGGAGVERGARRSSLVRSIGLGPFTRFQRRHDLLELGDAGALGRQQRLEFLDPQVERCQLGVSLATATLGPSQGCDPGTELGLVLPPTLGRRLHGTRRPRLSSVARATAAAAVSSRAAAVPAFATASSRAAAVTPPEAAAPSRQPRWSNRSPSAVTTTASGVERARVMAASTSPTRTALASRASSNRPTPASAATT